MCSAVSASLATAYKIRGLSYSISAACAASAHCIGAGADLIRHGAQDIVFAGGGEELHWTMSVMFDAMGALSTGYNDRPAVASRPTMPTATAFVIGSGGGMLVLEGVRARSQARRTHPRRTARLWRDLGRRRHGRAFRRGCGALHAAWRCKACSVRSTTSTPALRPRSVISPGLGAVQEVFGAAAPPLSSTKALSGHSLGAASVHEAIYSLLMMRDGFMAGSAHIAHARPARGRLPDPARKPRSQARHRDVEQLWLWRHQCRAGVQARLKTSARVPGTRAIKSAVHAAVCVVVASIFGARPRKARKLSAALRHAATRQHFAAEARASFGQLLRRLFER